MVRVRGPHRRTPGVDSRVALGPWRCRHDILRPDRPALGGQGPRRPGLPPASEAHVDPLHVLPRHVLLDVQEQADQRKREADRLRRRIRLLRHEGVDHVLVDERGAGMRERVTAEFVVGVNQHFIPAATGSYERFGESHFSTSSIATPRRLAYDSTWSRPMRPTLKYFASGCEK